jgi:hypothetical protein
MRHTTAFVLSALIALASTLKAQEVPATPFAAALTAHGGEAVWAVETLVIRGQSRRGAETTPVTIQVNLDGRVRFDWSAARAEVRTPEGSFELSGARVAYKARHDGLWAQLDWLSIFGIRHMAAAVLTAAGSGTIGGRLSDHVKADNGRELIQYRRAIKDEATVSFDRETHLVAAISRVQYASESLDLAFQLSTTFSDYRPVGGLVLPFRIDRFLDGQLKETVTVDSVEINTPLSPGLFRPPEQGR